jgi:hypothetical protein
MNWKRILADLSPDQLQQARLTYKRYLDVHTRFPGLDDPHMHDNAVTALREIDRRLRK